MVSRLHRHKKLHTSNSVKMRAEFLLFFFFFLIFNCRVFVAQECSHSRRGRIDFQQFIIVYIIVASRNYFENHYQMKRLCFGFYLVYLFLLFFVLTRRSIKLRQRGGTITFNRLKKIRMTFFR